MNAIFDLPKGMTKCKRLLQFPSPTKDCHAPVKKQRKRKLLKEDVLKAVSLHIYLFNTCNTLQRMKMFARRLRMML